MKNTTLLMLLLVGFACQQKPQAQVENETNTDEESSLNISLQKMWETDSLLTTSEAVIYHPTLDVLFVSCINGTPPDKADQDGFIAQVSPTDGEILNLKWIEGLSAPKGMGIVGNSLFVTDINQVVEIDIDKAEIIATYPIEGAAFLNDITTTDDGTVLISDTGTNIISMIKDQQLSTFVSDPALENPNGLDIADGKLFIASYGPHGKFIEMNMETKETKIITDSIMGGDGVIALSDYFIVSTWPGQIYLVSSGGSKTLLIDTREEKINAADIYPLLSQGLIFVPTFFDNRVVAYGIAEAPEPIEY
ncbi:hypothetical protein BFP72_10740 [Reichenbachiella sp. 5M10]|uniref:ATP-binding protein n=1 Tax=Reichenbachiella sp. 5M10 TaxID=1889772 RepID=UPI000C149211|nr:ATP-binding protein [Reichenbachiella sp. 5M10]PIB35834.1 hypothetical protein BFP72_10740 [Reichenbachiella sp. 5M10]